MPSSLSVAVTKNMPGSMIAIANMDIPAIFAYGGTIAPGNLDGKDIDLVSVLKVSENGTMVT